MTGLESRTIDSEYIDVKMAKQHQRQPQQITRTMRIHSRYDEKNIFKLIRNGRLLLCSEHAIQPKNHSVAVHL